MKKYLHSCFNKDYANVIGCNIYIQNENFEFDDITFSIWEISSNNRFKDFRSSFFHGACATLIFLDLNSNSDFEEAPQWIHETSNILGSKPIFLIGYRLDSNYSDVSPEKIEEFCNQYHCTYVEINSNNDNLDALFKQIADFTLEAIGYNHQVREELYKKHIKQNRKFLEVLVNLGYKINNNKNIEILTSKGIFTINILNGKVYYEHFICEKCDKRDICKERVKNYNVKKSLCIVRKEDPGWSNILNSNQLLILSKIFAIVEDKLPIHVLNQIKSSIHCNYGKTIFKNICISIDKKVERILPFNRISKKQVGEIKTKLRNLEIQFWSGSVPSEIYTILKNKYLKALDSLN